MFNLKKDLSISRGEERSINNYIKVGILPSHSLCFFFLWIQQHLGWRIRTFDLSIGTTLCISVCWGLPPDSIKILTINREKGTKWKFYTICSQVYFSFRSRVHVNVNYRWSILTLAPPQMLLNKKHFHVSYFNQKRPLIN